jgi:hypothetical protein
VGGDARRLHRAALHGTATGARRCGAGGRRGAFGVAYQLFFSWRVWRRWSTAAPEIQEPLAWAIASLADWRQLLALALPVLVLAALVAWRVGAGAGR